MNAPVTSSCLDAETIAAWVDGGLDDASVAAAEAHASTCERCQAILAAVAKTTPAVVAETRPFRIPAWWYPIAAGAAAAVIWMIVPEQREIATAPPSPAAVREVAPSQPPAAAPKENVPAPAARDQLAASAKKPAAAKNNEQPRQSAQDSKLKDQAAVEAQVAAAEPAQGARAARMAPPAPAAPAPMLQKAERFEARADVASPDGSKRWRFADYGDTITGGSAVSSTVCWLIGRGGLVMLTTNGTSFEHVDLPDRVDVVAITATDAKSAIVTTADGRRFQTGDGGRNWRQIQA